jgi:hypothetical protein
LEGFFCPLELESGFYSSCISLSYWPSFPSHFPNNATRFQSTWSLPINPLLWGSTLCLGIPTDSYC